MHSTEMTDELKILANQENINLADLRELIYLVFKFIREKITSTNRNIKEYIAIRVMGIGIFHVTPAKQKKLNEKIDYGNKDNNIE